MQKYDFRFGANTSPTHPNAPANKNETKRESHTIFLSGSGSGSDSNLSNTIFVGYTEFFQHGAIELAMLD